VSAGEAEETLSGSYGYQVGSGHIYSSFVLIPTFDKRSEGVIFVTRWDPLLLGRCGVILPAMT